MEIVNTCYSNDELEKLKLLLNSYEIYQNLVHMK